MQVVGISKEKFKKKNYNVWKGKENKSKIDKCMTKKKTKVLSCFKVQ